MNEQKYLACKILGKSGSYLVVESTAFDGSTFQINANPNNVVINGELGWLLVEVMGKEPKSNKTSIKLPAAVLNQGHNVVVSFEALEECHEILGQMEDISKLRDRSSES